MKNWSRGLIKIYRYLKTLSNAIDNMINKNAINSNYYYSGKFTTAYSMSTKLLELIYRKQKIVNLKVIIEDALFKMDKENRRLLALVYLDGVKSIVVAKLMGISPRTFFRKKKESLNNFENILKHTGYDDEKLKDMLCGEKWFIDNIDRINIEDEDSDDIDNNIETSIIIKKMVRDLSNVPKKMVSTYF